MTFWILRNIVVEPIVPYLRYLGLQAGFNVRIHFGEYDNVVQEALCVNNALANSDVDCIMIFLYLDAISTILSSQYACVSEDEIKNEIHRIRGITETIIEGIRRKTAGMLLWHGFEVPLYPSKGVFDLQREGGQLAVVRELNDFVRDVLRRNRNCYFVDMDLLLRLEGGRQFYDKRFWHIGRAPYSKRALQSIAFEDFKFIRALKGKNKKCLVLDCDNTLWGGIVGEDGLSGIRLSKTYPGSGYYELQRRILELYCQGIILAICSKNNEGDVWEVFEKHPDMLLKKSHVATAQINWKDKASNLQQIALDLNIGLDSLVLLDDSEFETNLIRQKLPEVEVIYLPKGKAVEYANILASCGLFDSLTISREDKRRGTMYKAETERKNLKAQITDMESYYRTLEMVVDIRFATELDIPRVAQQTQRTNQFNLTTRRYSEDDIKCFEESPDDDVLTVQLSDIFGDLGIVGTCIVRYEERTAVIDTFLLSCRALGREVEDVFILHILNQARRRGCRLVVGEYIKTRKNSQVESFYIKHGFREVGDTKEKNRKNFHYDLRMGTKEGPDFFKEIRSEVKEGE